MELSPQKVRSMSFSTAKKGYDKSEVDAFVGEVAGALETAQNETTAMEARARAAIARLKEVSQQTAAPADESIGTAAPSPAPATSPAPEAAPATSPDDSETISRTLLLAQRTADATVADANAQAESLISNANAEADKTLAEAREQADQMVAEARVQARIALEEDRAKAEQEVNELRGRRDVLESDVEHLEEFLIAQRDRLRGAASQLIEVVDRVPDGLGQMRRPLLSADDASEPADDATEQDGGDDTDDDDMAAEKTAVPGTGTDDIDEAVEQTTGPGAEHDDAAPGSGEDETHELGHDELRAAAAAGNAQAAESSAPPFNFGLATDDTSTEGHR